MYLGLGLLQGSDQTFDLSLGFSGGKNDFGHVLTEPVDQLFEGSLLCDGGDMRGLDLSDFIGVG